MHNPYKYDSEHNYRETFFMSGSDDDPRGIDDPGLNRDTEGKDDEDFEESDDFHKYDDVDKANVDIDDEISLSNESTNSNRENERPTFNRTYDKNASDVVDDIGKYDGNISI